MIWEAKWKPEPQRSPLQEGVMYDWFAWRPVRLSPLAWAGGSHNGGWAWLSTVRRSFRLERHWDMVGLPYTKEVWRYYVLEQDRAA